MDDTAKLMWTKFGALAILFIITLGFGSIPFWFFKGRNDNARIPSRAFSILNCFAGGVFLGLCLLDLFPDVIESFEETLPAYIKFPIAELSVTCGLVLVLVIEQIVHGVQHKLVAKRKREEERASLSQDSRTLLADSTHSNRNFGTFDSPGSVQLEPEKQALVAIEEPENQPFPNHTSPSHDRETESNNTPDLKDITQVEHADNEGPTQDHDVTAYISSHIGDSHDTHAPPSTFRSLMLLGALSFHSILEGIAVGILTSTSEVWTFILAIGIHKVVISFSLSINFLTTMKKLNALFCQIAFAIMSPIGISIGMVIISQIDKFSSSIWEGILQGWATGTFLYVTFFELLPREIEAPRDKIFKIVAILSGLGVIAGLIAYEVSHE